MEKKKIIEKFPEESITIKTEIVCPNDTNPMDILQGGRLVQWMDIAAAVSAQTHAECICVTVFISELCFHHSAKVGDIITIHARLTRSFKTSMEVLVEAFTKGLGEHKIHLVSSGYFTFVALDKRSAPKKVIPLKPSTEMEIKHYNAALQRRKK